MNGLLSALKTKDSTTTNGAITHSTSNVSCLDLFFIAGASRSMSEKDIETLLSKAFNENPELATVLVFWAGDIRGGIGERRFFQIALNYLYKNHYNTFLANLGNVQLYNRWDSLFKFHNDQHVLEYVSQAIKSKNGLLAKWLPREGKSKNQEFRKALMRHMKLSSKNYRKLVSSLSKTVEQQLSNKQFDKIEYKKVPSVAFNKYRKAFKRNDTLRFSKFLENVRNGKDKINASAIFPHTIIKSFQNGGDSESINLQWKALPDYMIDTDERILPLCDVSGSMEGLPMEISIALGIYISERNNGPFKDHFLTFSENPKLQSLSGNLTDRIIQLSNADWGYNTNLIKVFQLILQKARIESISNNEMPTTLLIISDMEFDQACRSNTNFESIRKLYEQAGYKMPKIVFWNVNGRLNNVPVKSTQKNVALISGASPAVIKGVLGAKFTPEDVMLDTLNNSRYDNVIFLD